MGDPWRTVEGLADPSHTVEGLVNGRTYTFHVTAIDAMGRSLGPMQVAVAPVGPPSAPTGLSGRGGDGEAVLAWDAAYSAEDDPVVDHVVQSSTDGIEWTTHGVGTTSGATATVTGLANESVLEFRVMAVNGRGTGPASDPVTVVVGQPDVPTGLVAVTGDGTVRLSWVAPADDGGSPVLDYVVERRIDSGWTVVDDGTSTESTAVVDGLANGIREDFRVAAVTAVGRGPAGEVVSAVAGRPDPVTDLRATVGDGTVALSWTATAHDGGSEVVDHRIEYSVDDGSSWDRVDGEVGVATEATVHGLDNGTSYRFRVAVETAIGTSRTRSVGAASARRNAWCSTGTVPPTAARPSSASRSTLRTLTVGDGRRSRPGPPPPPPGSGASPRGSSTSCGSPTRTPTERASRPTWSGCWSDEGDGPPAV